MSANSLTQSILCYLNYNGFVAWSTYNGAVYDVKKQAYRANPTKKKGISDVIGFRKSDGRHIEVEVKYGKDKESIFQEMHQEELKKSHCIAIVARSFDQFENEIKEYETKLKNL